MSATLPEVPALAEHCYGGAYRNEPFTRLTRGKLWADGGAFIANADGHLGDGSVYPILCHGRAYRLTLVAAPARKAAA